MLTASAAVFHILNIGDQTVCSYSIQCFYADSQYTGCFLPCNQFIHRLLRHPFGICPVFFSLPVPECNNQAESLQLHQSHASAPYLPPKIANHAYLVTGVELFCQYHRRFCQSLCFTEKEMRWLLSLLLNF